LVLLLALAGVVSDAVSWRWMRAAHALEAGRQLQRRGELRPSARAFAAAVSLVPELDDHHLARARVQVRLASEDGDRQRREEQFQEVEKNLRDRFQKRPLETRYLEELAYLHSRWGELVSSPEAAAAHRARAAQAYGQALKRDPWNARLRRSLGAVLLEQGRYREAVEELSLAAELSPRSSVGHLVLGRALFELERVDEARKAFERAVNLDAQTSWRILDGVARAHPDSWRAHRDLAVLLAIQGKTREAAAAAEMALGAAEEDGATAFAQANSTLEGAF
jgi:tetratricopeptide (TPR) repeat protein